MQSAHCRLRVSKALAAVPGVLINKIVPGEADITLDREEIRTDVYDAIQSSGYTIAGVATDQPIDAEAEGRTFKTNINCSGCVAQAAPLLDETVGSGQWRVDTGDPDKILTVTAAGLSEEKILDAVRGAGFTAHPITR